MSAEYTPESNVESNLQDDSYASQMKEPVPVQSDNKDIEDPVDASFADSDQQLAQDDKEAIDESNIMDDRTRGAKPMGTYQEPGDNVAGLE
ncbi:uncharacterized protein TrAtP1_002954 [Trichoderma atroviride]|uniref:Histone chaperone domain-containing protein n=1 Tax=Hypocrea atroviridis (strain ATCC 20476 / IMI 206040) TaxID=452589 RepID=G9NUY2_HYPAI|nr:uncharacterized protein TRIATDRAFT_37871 [Trichoderma atroviride IMI 206040]EHK44806.1 hypothetical protein TRIATDRAFT_37871 [Trichoderma atroviride IMI 206040]UKZ61697.1 hypothetical protein TrAtP1_002954 [Trichoderma atroviride]